MEKTKAIETYLNEIGPTPLLSDAEEQELARRIAGGGRLRSPPFAAPRAEGITAQLSAKCA